MSTAAPSFAHALASKATQPHAAKATREVATTRTPLSPSEAAQHIAEAWKTIHHEEPSPKLVSILVAQWSVETGGGKSMVNYNFGGIKGTGPSGLTTACRTKEGYDQTERVITDHFRAYRSPKEGAVDYVRLLQSRFPAAVEKARAGDPAGFVHALKQSGYFTGSEEAYTKLVTSLVAQSERSGFDATRPRAPSHHTTTAAPSSPLPSASLPILDPMLGTLPIGASDLPAPSTIDLLAFTDAMSRSALRIAGDSSEGR